MNLTKKIIVKLGRLIRRGKEEEEFKEMISTLQAYNEAFATADKLSASFERRAKLARELISAEREIHELRKEGSQSSLEKASVVALSLAEQRLKYLRKEVFHALPADEKNSMFQNTISAMSLLLDNASNSETARARGMMLEVAEMSVDHLLSDEVDKLPSQEKMHRVNLCEQSFKKLLKYNKDQLPIKAQTLLLRVIDGGSTGEDFREFRELVAQRGNTGHSGGPVLSRSMINNPEPPPSAPV